MLIHKFKTERIFEFDINIQISRDTRPKMDDIVMEIDAEEATNTNDNMIVDLDEKQSAVDIDKLLSLLEASKRAAHLIAGKHLLLLIGRTGAGKVSL